MSTPANANGVAPEKQGSAEDVLAGEIVDEVTRLSNERTEFEMEWEEASQRFMPSSSGLFNLNSEQNPGGRRTRNMVDPTGAKSADRFASIYDSILTPRNQTYQILQASNDKLNEQRDVKVYFEEMRRVLFKQRYTPRANFASQNNQNLMSLGVLGNLCMFTDDLWTPNGSDGLRYRSIHIGEIYFSENHQGLIECVYRVFRLNAKQAAKQFGEETLPDKIQSALKSGKGETFKFIHAVKPREDVDYDRRDHKGMELASYYVAVDDKKLLREKGYNTQPYSISRYMQAARELWGRGPAMLALPSQKTLDEQKKVHLRVGHHVADPRLLVADDGIIDLLSAKPGTAVPGGVNADGRALVHALQTGRLDITKEMMDEEKNDIKDSFLVTLFLLTQENPQMTAAEVMEKVREKGILLAPAAGRQETEYIGPMTERELDLLSRQGKLPPMPPILREAQGEYTIVHDSPLSRAMRAEEASGIMRTVEYAMNVSATTQDPSIMDHFDWDEIVPAVARIHGVPEKWMKDPRAIADMRAQREQQRQGQEMIQAAPGAAAMIKAQAASKKAGGGVAGV